MSKWSEAAERYRAGAPQPKPPLTKPAEGVSTLEEFLQSQDGKDALLMLKESGRFVRFAEDSFTTQCVTCWVLTGEGLLTSSGIGGMAAAYASEKDRQWKNAPSTAAEVEKAWLSGGGEGKGKTSSDIVPWLRGELDDIADAAP